MTPHQIKNYSKQQIINAAKVLLDRHGTKIRKIDVRCSIALNNATCTLWERDRERLVNRIWKEVRVLKGLTL